MYFSSQNNLEEKRPKESINCLKCFYKAKAVKTIYHGREVIFVDKRKG